MIGLSLFSTPAKIFYKNIVVAVNSGSSGVVVSCGCVARLKLEPDNQVEMNNASLNRVKKKIRDVFFDVPNKVRQSLVTLPALIADGLFCRRSSWRQLDESFGAHLDINRLEIVVDKDYLRLKKLSNPSEDFVGAGFKMYTSEHVEVSPGGFTVNEVVHCPIP